MEEGFLFKDVFNPNLVARMGQRINAVSSEFDEDSFYKDIVPKLPPLSLSERSNLIFETLFTYLPDEYNKAINILLSSFDPLSKTCEMTGFEGFYFMPIAKYVSTYGLEEKDFELSMKALIEITKRFTSEDAIRPFIRKYPKQTFEYLYKWTADENVNVRRLVSEETRPRLPWSSVLREFIDDPKPVLNLLDELKQDTELYVRRSVANNLNDIAKDHPQLVLKALKRWKTINDKGTQWIISHASRTLLKQGLPEALDLLGYPSDVKISVDNLILNKEECKMGEEIEFSFNLVSKASKEQNLMIDFVVHYMKANGKTAPKVFKLSKKKLPAEGKLSLKKKLSFKAITTRKYYQGLHEIEIQVNGKRYSKLEFKLKK
ncbi:DNA alkylation repair protein [Ancylomarina euxinus]|uniref:DNA alkylation repair protein n=1 Tax=Ancylomarina euxinus TaxID=2283627 RepID=A0A425XZU6_9BACT|nr:DNA alkylation repair protein [Ancylomarina euxinus]MCZ4695461.1 DNA alkylation repair protein [Ancylomarina euxinus]MUP15721.1 DNA alkylation repair protein [Ancylomarina euxinus]RRG20711.1 DNA alkylation repair protein [Ancylomarina euxinus]